MSPVLLPDDFVLTSRWFFSPKIGNIVVVNHPVYGQIIKRIHAVNTNGDFQLTGENAQSITSNQIGWMPRESCVGKVIYSIKNKYKRVSLDY